MKTLPLILAATLLAAAPAHASDDDDDTSLDDTPHITIVGSASTEVDPDIATITLGVATEKPTAKAAADETATKMRALVEAAKAQGVQPDDIATQAVGLTQTFDEVRDAQGRQIGRKPRGYEADNAVSIRIRDLAKAGDIAESLIDTGANRFDGITFSVEHPQPILDKLEAEAVANAKRRAQLVADAAGVKLGRVLTIARPGTQRPQQFFRLAGGATFGGPAMPVEPGREKLDAEMEVTWAIDGN